MKQKLNLMNRQDILSFVFTRHPFDRLESAYFDKIIGDPGEGWQNLSQFIKKRCK